MTFELPKELEDWSHKHCEHCKSYATAGEHFVYEFIMIEQEDPFLQVRDELL